MNNCLTCKWDKKGMICQQGHVRKTKYENLKAVGQIPLENCHAWEEKEKECRWCRDWEAFGRIFSGHNYNLVKRLLGFSEKPGTINRCPKCGNKIMEE